MKEKPILFSGEMVRAILNGRKTQTRRVVKPQPRTLEKNEPYPRFWYAAPGVKNSFQDRFYAPKFPYGQVGDRLWVRETWHAGSKYDKVRPLELPKSADIWYRTRFNEKFDPKNSVPIGKTRPSIFMPRWASRIDLLVTGVKVEQLQDITQDDAKAEGVQPKSWIGNHQLKDYRQGFIELWNLINGKPRKDGVDISWNANPWVWVVEFELIEQ